MTRPSASEVAKMLAERIKALCAELLPAGRRESAEWTHPSLTGTSQRALSVHLVGVKAGIWSEFDGGLAGDALDLVAHVLYCGDKKKAYAWALRWLGIADGGVPAAMSAPPAAKAPDVEAERRRRAAQAMWLSAEAAIGGTPVDFYLQARGIDLRQLGRQPAALRFAAELFNKESGRHRPAMLAAVCNPSGRFVAAHRTWLARDQAGIWRKAPLRNPKMTLGSCAGGTIRLWRGASGKPLAAAPDDDTVVIAEGIETALSVAVACPEMRVLSAVSLGNLSHVQLPAQLVDVIVAADNDGANPAAERMLERAVDRLLQQGRSVRIARSSSGKDFNDPLRGSPA